MLAAPALLMAGLGQAKAEFIVYNTFGPGDSFSQTGAATISGSGSPAGYAEQAFGFTPTSTTHLVQVRFAAFRVSAFFPGTIEALFTGSVGNTPGSPLETLGTVSPALSGQPAIFTLSSFDHPLLTAGTLYWLDLLPDPSNGDFLGGWMASSPPVFGPSADRQSLNGGWISGVSQQGAFEIIGTQPVPEPSSLTLAGIGTISLLGYGGLRRKQAAA
jgi:hypothetical protein